MMMESSQGEQLWLFQSIVRLEDAKFLLKFSKKEKLIRGSYLIVDIKWFFQKIVHSWKLKKKNVMFAFEFSIVKCMLFSDCKR